MPRSIKKGPFIDHHLMDKVSKAVESKDKETYPNMVQKVYDFSRNGRFNNLHP